MLCKLFLGSSFFFIVDNQNAKNAKKIISIFGTFLILINIWTLFEYAESDPVFLIFAFILYLLSGLIFWSSIASTKKNRLDFAFTENSPKIFVMHGPFKYIRHPIYLSYMLAWTAGAIGSKFYLIVFAAAISSFYIIAAKKEEQQFLNSQYGEQYKVYKERTKMFIPFIV